MTATLRVWDARARSYAGLAPGATVAHYHILRSPCPGADGPEEPYMMHFESGGREYSCSLAAFQARTQPAEAAGAGAVAV